MAIHDIEVAFIHSDHFHVAADSVQGKNLAKQNSGRLDTREQRDMKLKYDDEKKLLIVTHGGRDAWIPEAAVKSMFPFTAAGKEAPMAKNISGQRNPNIKAQVDYPQSHVHAGPGMGKSK
jgi:hypothetical protein